MTLAVVGPTGGTAPPAPARLRLAAPSGGRPAARAPDAPPGSGPGVPAEGARPASTAAFLRRALDTMRRRSPARYADVAASLGRVPAHVTVGRERFTVRAEAARVRVRAGWQGEARARVDATTAAVLVSLVDGGRPLRAVLADESLVVRAGADALLDLGAAVSAFAAEAVAIPAYVRQFEEYRAWAAAR